jgi:hypothetical protein
MGACSIIAMARLPPEKKWKAVCPVFQIIAPSIRIHIDGCIQGFFGSSTPLMADGFMKQVILKAGFSDALWAKTSKMPCLIRRGIKKLPGIPAVPKGSRDGVELGVGHGRSVFLKGVEGQRMALSKHLSSH